MAHCQVILPPERSCVGPVGRWRDNRVRDRAVVTPSVPHVSNACAAALRGSCRNDVTGTGVPGKYLRPIVADVVHSEG